MINVTVLEIVEINPHISQRQIICELNISAKTVYRVLRANSHHISLYQALLITIKDFVLDFADGHRSK